MKASMMMKLAGLAIVLAVVLAATVLTIVLSSRGGSAGRQREGSCLAPESLPTNFPALASATDCVSDFIGLPDGTRAVGTAEGLLGVLKDGQLATFQPTGATGKVDGLSIMGLGRDQRDADAWLVGFNVDQGIGLFDPKSGQQIMLGSDRKFTRFDGLPVDYPADHIALGYYMTFEPKESRAQQDDYGRFIKIAPDGKEVAFLPQGGVSVVCGVYIYFPGAVPQREWCVHLSDLFPEPLVGDVDPTIDEGGPCAHVPDISLDADHRIAVTVDRDGFKPDELTVKSGEFYVLTLENLDGGAGHGLNVIDASGQPVRDARGEHVCINVIPGGASSTSFILPGGTASNLTYIDPIHPTKGGRLNVVPSE